MKFLILFLISFQVFAGLKPVKHRDKPKPIEQKVSERQAAPDYVQEVACENWPKEYLLGLERDIIRKCTLTGCKNGSGVYSCEQ